MTQQHWKLDELKKWLASQSTPAESSPSQSYRHQLLTEHFDQRSQILEKLKLVFWRAHEDARRYRQGESLDFLIPGQPSPLGENLTRWQPWQLPIKTLKGYFGEVFAGLIAENFAPFGVNDWIVPVFLFRSHDTAYSRLEQIEITNQEAKDVPGRLGNDCLAFQLGSNGLIKRSLVCEAKCSAGKCRSDMVSKAFSSQLSDKRLLPESIWQIIEVLRDRGSNNEVYDALRHGSFRPRRGRKLLYTFEQPRP